VKPAMQMLIRMLHMPFDTLPVANFVYALFNDTETGHLIMNPQLPENEVAEK